MLLAKAVDALNDGFLVHLADDLALEAVLIRSDLFAEKHFEVAFGLAREVEAGSLHDSINGVHVMPDVAPSSAYLKVIAQPPKLHLKDPVTTALKEFLAR